MKKTTFSGAAAALLLVAMGLGLPACSRDTLGGEQRASSPEAAEFNQDVSEGSRTADEVRDSAAHAGKQRRVSPAAAPQ